jgi:hypothetical protein
MVRDGQNVLEYSLLSIHEEIVGYFAEMSPQLLVSFGQTVLLEPVYPSIWGTSMLAKVRLRDVQLNHTLFMSVTHLNCRSRETHQNDPAKKKEILSSILP